MPPLYSSPESYYLHRGRRMFKGRGMSNNRNSVGVTVPSGASLLLDTLSASATAAYCLHTRIKTSYTGAFLRVRRSNDNTESDIDDSGSGALANLASFVGANSGFVTKVYDQSGNGRDLVQATNAEQPRVRNSGTTDTGATNGLLCTTFDGSQQWLHRTATMGVSGDPNITVACDSDATSTGDMALWCLGSDSNGPLSMFWNGTANGDVIIDDWSSAAGWGTSSTRDAPSRWMVTRTAGANLSDTIVYRNNSALTRTTGTDTSKPNIDTSHSSWGAHTAFGNGWFFWAGKASYYVIFGSVLDSTDRSTFDTWAQSAQV